MTLKIIKQQQIALLKSLFNLIKELNEEDLDNYYSCLENNIGSVKSTTYIKKQKKIFRNTEHWVYKIPVRTDKTRSKNMRYKFSYSKSRKFLRDNKWSALADYLE